MPVITIIALGFHVLSAVFWAGSSFTLARTAGAGAERLFRPQMGAAAVAFLTGAYLWSSLHHGQSGRTEQILGLGALCAIGAAGIQGAIGGPAVRAIRAGADQAKARSRATLAQTMGSGLLALALICMVIARYV